MAARLPRLIRLLLGGCLSVAGAQAQAPGDTAASTRVITGETLRRAGATRLTDVLLLAGGWQTATVEGLTWHASPPGGSPFTPARWEVLVDGRPAAVDLFGSTSLGRLGVAVEQIERVELVELPRLVAGRLTTQGIVHIHTADPAPGPSAGGWFATGGEIGDPGPFAFTPLGTTNVDRNGHDASARVAYGAESWSAAATLGWGEVIPTDPAIAERYAAALGPRPRLEIATGSLRASARLGGGWHQFAARHSRVGGALGLAPFGAEIATRERLTQVGAGGTIPAGGRRDLIYDVSHTSNRARKRGGAPSPALDWNARTLEARLEVAQRTSPLRNAGLRLRRIAASSDGAAVAPAIELVTAYAALGPGSAAVTLGEGETGVAASVSRSWAVTPASTVEGIVAYERTPRAEDNSIWAWTERGYRLLPEASAAFEVAGRARAPTRISADLLWSARAIGSSSVAVRALYRRERNLSIERRRLHFVPETGSFDGFTTLAHGPGGELGGGTVEIVAPVLTGVTVRASYRYQAVLGGDSLFREAWAAVPRHAVLATGEWVPVRGLELWLSVRYRSASRWAEFEAVEAESGGRYAVRMAPAFSFDLAIQKWLWDERLRAHFGVRNLPGSDLRYHPAGAIFAPAALVLLEGRLP